MCERNWHIHHAIRHETCPSLFFVSYTLILEIILDTSSIQKLNVIYFASVKWEWKFWADRELWKGSI